MIGQQQVYDYLQSIGISYDYYEHPEAPTIEIAKQFYRGEGTTLCKNLFFRNHKGNRHFLVIMDSTQAMDIHSIEKVLHQGKLSFASPERMMRYLGLEPGSVSPFGLINDTEHHVILFLDSRLKDAPALSFHPNDCRGTVVISQEAFQQYLDEIGNKVEYLNVTTI